MVYHGHVQNGRVELDQPIPLPEGAEVQLIIVGDEGQSSESAAAAAGRPEPPKPIEEVIADIVADSQYWIAVNCHSQTRVSACLSTRSERYIPASRSCSMTGPACGMIPRFLAVSTSPRVPRTGMPNAAAQRRAARSSMIASVPG